MDIIRLSIGSDGSLELTLSLWVLSATALTFVFITWLARRLIGHHRVVSLNVSLGGIGHVEIRPSRGDIAVAHRIWTELVTRKAALQIDPENDVISHVYDSWYALFGTVRQLIGDLPPELLRNHRGTRRLIRVAIDSLNLGLRPHLTRWEARYRTWYAARQEELKTRDPQDVQKDFPDYKELIEDMLRVNRELIQYAEQLEKLIAGEER